MSAYRQAVPGWRKRQLNHEEVDRDFAFNARRGAVMGFEDETEEELKPLGSAGQHTIGRSFILAGRAIFTVSGKRNRFTYRVSRKDSDNPRYPEPTYFVSVLTGTNNETSYSYMAILDVRSGQLKFTKGSKIKATAPAAVALAWTLARVWQGRDLPSEAAIYHEGRCGRCGRPLTVPESIESGFGPDCAGLIGVEL